MSLACGDEVPQISTRKSRLRPSEFLTPSAKRLLQHYRPQANQQRLSLRDAARPHDRAASATLATVKTSAAICESPSGSCSAIAETTTPITGTSVVPIAATEAGRRST